MRLYNYCSLILLVSLCLIACKKQTKKDDNSIVGKWILGSDAISCTLLIKGVYRQETRTFSSSHNNYAFKRTQSYALDSKCLQTFMNVYSTGWYILDGTTKAQFMYTKAQKGQPLQQQVPVHKVYVYENQFIMEFTSAAGINLANLMTVAGLQQQSGQRWCNSSADWKVGQKMTIGKQKCNPKLQLDTEIKKKFHNIYYIKNKALTIATDNIANFPSVLYESNRLTRMN